LNKIGNDGELNYKDVLNIINSVNIDD